MGSAPVRRGFETRALSSQRRGAYVGPGMPGVYRVTRARTIAQAAPLLSGVAGENPWTQLDDYTIEADFGNSGVWTAEGPVADEGDFTDEEIAGWFKENTAGLASAWDKGSPSSLTGKHSLNLRWISDVSPLLQGDGTFRPIAAGVGTLVPDAPDLPDGASGYEWETTFGQLVGDATVDIAYTVEGDPNTDCGASLWWSTQADDPFRVVSYITSHFTHLLSVGGGAASTFSFSIPADVFGTDPSEITATELWLYGLTEAIESPGAGERLAFNIDLNSAGYDIEFTATLTYTIRPPRVRFTFPDPSSWTPTDSVDGYVWDAGLYLGAVYEDALAGLPGSPPAGCDTLAFYIAPPAYDFFLSGSYDRLDQVSSGGTLSDGSTGAPTVGSHIWVVWFGPAFDPDVDPVPDVTPASLISAALAENGEG